MQSFSIADHDAPAHLRSAVRWIGSHLRHPFPPSATPLPPICDTPSPHLPHPFIATHPCGASATPLRSGRPRPLTPGREEEKRGSRERARGGRGGRWEGEGRLRCAAACADSSLNGVAGPTSAHVQMVVSEGNCVEALRQLGFDASHARASAGCVPSPLASPRCMPWCARRSSVSSVILGPFICPGGVWQFRAAVAHGVDTVCYSFSSVASLSPRNRICLQ